MKRAIITVIMVAGMTGLIYSTSPVMAKGGQGNRSGKMIRSQQNCPYNGSQQKNQMNRNTNKRQNRINSENNQNQNQSFNQQKGFGPGDGTGNQGERPMDGTGYGTPLNR
ncbi:MAG: hypothetical protein ACQESN_10510 [Thermotogota bacterium]